MSCIIFAAFHNIFNIFSWMYMRHWKFIPNNKFSLKEFFFYNTINHLRFHGFWNGAIKPRKTCQSLQKDGADAESGYWPCAKLGYMHARSRSKQMTWNFIAAQSDLTWGRIKHTLWALALNESNTSVCNHFLSWDQIGVGLKHIPWQSEE